MKTDKELDYILKWHKKIKALKILGSKCFLCGESRPWLLSFHHKNKNEKEFTINKIRNHRLTSIKKEVLKCELLCERCHRELHNQNKETVHTKSKKILLDIKSVSGCEICGYNKCFGALDFHHEKDKNFEISRIKIGESSGNEIKEKMIKESSKCIILCRNCHSDLHFDKEKFIKYENEIKNWHYQEHKKPLNPNEVIKLFNEGIKPIEIAKQLDRNKSVIYGIIKKCLQSDSNRY